MACAGLILARLSIAGAFIRFVYGTMMWTYVIDMLTSFYGDGCGVTEKIGLKAYGRILSCGKGARKNAQYYNVKRNPLSRSAT